MLLRTIRLENFKSFQAEEVQLAGRLTVLVGKNNSGKSNLIDSVVLVHDILSMGDLEAVNRRGGSERIPFGGEDAAHLELEVKLREEDFTALVQPQPGQGRPVLIAVEVTRTGRVDVTASVSGARRYSLDSWSRMKADDEVFDSAVLEPHLSHIYHLMPHRTAPGDQIGARGQTELDPSGSNLWQVLNSLATSDQPRFNRIDETSRELVPELQNVRAPLVPGQPMVQGVFREAALPSVEFYWSNIAEGSRQILILVTLLLATPRESILLIEEPELFLHPHVQVEMVKLIKEVAASEDKQVVLSTHSPVIVEAAGLEAIRMVVRHADGTSHVAGISSPRAVDGMLRKHGILRNFMLTPRQPGVVPGFMLIVEGKDDIAVWTKILERAGMKAPNIVVIRGEDSDAVSLALFMKYLRDSGFASVPFLLTIDSDGDPDGKGRSLEGQGLSPHDFSVLPKKEIEDYLLDPHAIGAVTGAPAEEVQRALATTKGAGKERLEKVLREVGLTQIDTSTKELLALHLPQIPPDLQKVVDRISASLKQSETA